MDHLQEFAELMGTTAPTLDRALSLIAAHGRAEVDPASLIDAFDDLATVVDVGGSRDLCGALFGPFGFHGDTANYHDPQNSLIDRVFARHLGIPITLSVVAIEVGRRRGIDMVGVGMPGHFVLRDGHDETLFFDPFDGGTAMDPDGCREVFARLHGPEYEFERQFLDPTPNPMIVMRVLNNLHGAYARLRDRRGLARTLELQSAVPGAGIVVKRQLAAALAADGRFLDAAHQHEQLVASDPDHAEEHDRAAVRLRAQLN